MSLGKRGKIDSFVSDEDENEDTKKEEQAPANPFRRSATITVDASALTSAPQYPKHAQTKHDDDLGKILKKLLGRYFTAFSAVFFANFLTSNLL